MSRAPNAMPPLRQTTAPMPSLALIVLVEKLFRRGMDTAAVARDLRLPEPHIYAALIQRGRAQ